MVPPSPGCKCAPRFSGVRHQGRAHSILGTVFRRSATLIAALAAATLGSAAASPAVPPGDLDLDRWIDGPVRYLATAEEVRTFRTLDNDDSRALFVERFWLRRDPTPETLTNEYRALFWERVRQANENFTDSSWPGWKSDRGKVFILYGAPTQVQEYANLDSASGPTSSRGVIRWLYEGRPGERVDLDAVTVVPFVRDVTGEYRLTYDPVMASVFFDEWGIRDGQVRRFERYLTSIGGVGQRSEIGVMLDLGRLQEVPPMERVLIERVQTSENYSADPLPVQIDRFRDVRDEGTRVALSMRFPGRTPGQPPALLARLKGTGANGTERILGEGSFRFVSDRRGGLTAQGRIVLEPGTWELMVVAVDPETGRSAVHRSTVETLPHPTQVALSDVVLAFTIEPLESRALTSWDEPFVYGPFRGVPRIDRTLSHGETVEVLFRVEAGRPPYRVEYRLEGRENDGRWVSIGRPSATTSHAEEQAWQLPVGSAWPAGEYRVVVGVRDEAGDSAEALIPFQVADASD